MYQTCHSFLCESAGQHIIPCCVVPAHPSPSQASTYPNLLLPSSLLYSYFCQLCAPLNPCYCCHLQPTGNKAQLAARLLGAFGLKAATSMPVQLLRLVRLERSERLAWDGPDSSRLYSRVNTAMDQLTLCDWEAWKHLRVAKVGLDTCMLCLYNDDQRKYSTATGRRCTLFISLVQFCEWPAEFPQSFSKRACIGVAGLGKWPGTLGL